jgi:hypothetical protein
MEPLAVKRYGITHHAVLLLREERVERLHKMEEQVQPDQLQEILH